MDFSFLSTYGDMFLSGTVNTILISLATLLFGCLLGVFICMARISNNKIIQFISGAYIEFLRGTPLLVQIYIVYFSFPAFGIRFPNIGPIPSDFVAGVFALTINSSAYISEILRSGIQAVDKGQMEASRSLGLNYVQSMKLVVIPQALKNVLPALANEFITLIKESSIISVIGIRDLMYTADIVRGNTYKPLEPLLVAAFIYFVLTFALSRGLAYIEKNMQNSDKKKVHILARTSESEE